MCPQGCTHGEQTGGPPAPRGTCHQGARGPLAPGSTSPVPWSRVPHVPGSTSPVRYSADLGSAQKTTSVNKRSPFCRRGHETLDQLFSSTKGAPFVDGEPRYPLTSFSRKRKEPLLLTGNDVRQQKEPLLSTGKPCQGGPTTSVNKRSPFCRRENHVPHKHAFVNTKASFC